MKHTATILLTDCVNGNRRIYPKAVVEKGLENFQTLVKNKAAFGTITDGPFVADKAPLVENHSHRVTDIYFSRDALIAEIETLDTEAGKALENLLKGSMMVFRTAGMGRIAVDDKTFEDFELAYVFAMPKHKSTPLRAS